MDGDPNEEHITMRGIDKAEIFPFSRDARVKQFKVRVNGFRVPPPLRKVFGILKDGEAKYIHNILYLEEHEMSKQRTYRSCSRKYLGSCWTTGT